MTTQTETSISCQPSTTRPGAARRTALVLTGVLTCALPALFILNISRMLLTGVETEHLRPLEPAVQAINAQFDIILSALPGIARKAAIVAERRPR